MIDHTKLTAVKSRIAAGYGPDAMAAVVDGVLSEIGACEVRINCRDCGEPLVESDYALKGKVRDDVCAGCWENRKWLVDYGINLLPPKKFADIQAAMGRGRGTAKGKIDLARKIVEGTVPQ